MDLWSIRNQALAALDSDLKQENEVLEEAFALLDKCIERLRQYIVNEGSHATFAVYCCCTILKTRRLAFGSYSLCLDGLVLEGCALMRSLIEGWQILTYFRLDPKRVELAVAKKMPQAGDIAKALDDELHNEIKDDLWQLRKRYSQFSSHFSLQKEALVPIKQVFNSEAIKTNMCSLFHVVSPVLFETDMCLSFIGLSDSALSDGIYFFIEKGLSVFGDYEEPE